MEPTSRFSNRVADYVRYRPSYPAETLAVLVRAGALTKESVVADVGSGTGLLSRLFLANGNRVIGIEPNRDMRQAGEIELRQYGQFQSIDASAEATTLLDGSVDLIVVGQAFHWFDRVRARREFMRILRCREGKPGGWVALIWNERLVEASPFLRGYEDLLREFSTDYSKVDHRQMTPELLAAFYAPRRCECTHLPNRQVFDFEGLRGRLMSSSYAPPAGDPRHAPMLTTLAKLFETHAENGRVAFEYETQIYLGRLE